MSHFSPGFTDSLIAWFISLLKLTLKYGKFFFLIIIVLAQRMLLIGAEIQLYNCFNTLNLMQ